MKQRIIGIMLALLLALSPLQALAAEDPALPDGESQSVPENSGQDSVPENQNNRDDPNIQDNQDGQDNQNNQDNQDGQDHRADPEGSFPENQDSFPENPDSDPENLPDGAPEAPEPVPEDIALLGLTPPDTPGQPDSETFSGQVQTYLTWDDQVHTIYWARGVTPPSMVGEGEHSFRVATVPGANGVTYTTYQAPMKTGYGYYDVNKPGTPVSGRPDVARDNRCYLGTATNLLYWWMDQNRDYIDWYVGELKQKPSRFRQGDSLVDIFSADWAALRRGPALQINAHNLYNQMLDGSSLAEGPFRTNYQQRKDGYFMDPVWDFFLNGFQAIQAPEDSDDVPVNSPDRFLRDPYGGYFYPIFGPKPLTARYFLSEFDFFERNLGPWLSSGVGVGLSYDGASSAHAITLWGAEYDETGALVRVYVTDTDDYGDPAYPGADVVRGLHSMNTVNYGGVLFLSNRSDADTHPGGRINGASTLLLGRDIWDQVQKDTNLIPLAPDITEQPMGRSYAPGEKPEALWVTGEMKTVDQNQGRLSYQWYEASDPEKTDPVPIPGANGRSYTPEPSGTLGTRYYFCRVTVTKYENTAFTDTAAAAVTVTDGEIRHAEAPQVKLAEPYVKNGSLRQILGDQGEKRLLRVEASVPRGQLSYQWYRASAYNSVNGFQNLQAIPGANSPSLEASFGSYDTSDWNAYYFCRVTNLDSDPTINGSRKASADTGILRMTTREPKKPQAPLTVQTAGTARYGETLQITVSGGSGTGSLSFKLLDGTGDLTLTDRGAELTLTGVGSFRLLVTRAGDDTYSSVQTEKTFQVEKARPQVTGVSCSTALTPDTDPEALVLNHQGTPGTVRLKPGTRLRPGTASYPWVFTPDQPEFYLTADGAVTLTVEGTAEKTAVTLRADPVNGPYDGKDRTGYENLSFEPAWTGTPTVTYRVKNGETLKGKPRDAGSYQVTVSIPESDPRYQGSLTLDFTVSPAAIEADTVILEKKIWDGTTAAAVSAVTWKSLAEGESLTLGEDYTAAAEFDHAGAGSGRTASVELTLSSHVKNYTLGAETLVLGLEGQTIYEAPIPAVTLTLKTPAIGEIPQTQVYGEGFTGALVWTPDHEVFRADTPYQAILTLTPDGNHCFTEDTTLNGSSATLDPAAGTLLKTYAYEAMAAPETDTMVEIPQSVVADIASRDTLWVDGSPVPVVKKNGKFYLDIPGGEDRTILTYEFLPPTDGDIHTSYPTAMEVYRLYADGSFRHLPGLTDLLTYSGMSIRIKGVRGIRMITGVESDVKNRLIHSNVDGCTLVEYGTTVAWADELEPGAEPVIGGTGARHSAAYVKGKADPVFAHAGSKVQYTNVMVGLDPARCGTDVAIRSYAVLEEADGSRFTVYGGTLWRSVGYVAYQNRATFKPGTPAYAYVWEIIHGVYGDQFDSEYQE